MSRRAEDQELTPLTLEQLNVLHTIGSMSDEDFESHKRLIALEPDVTHFFTKRKAYALVFGSLSKAVTWFAAFVGGLWLGFDKIKALFGYIVSLLIQTT